MLFYYIRHGDPIYDPDSLTPLGKRQAEAVAKRLCRYGIDEIYVSSSQRAKETAMPTCEIMKKDFVELDWCHEAHAWRQLAPLCENGKQMWCFMQAEYRKLFLSDKIRSLGNKWYEAEEFKNLPFKEGILRIQNEEEKFFENLGYRHDREHHCFIAEKPNDKRIAMFAHHGFGMAFLSSILDIPYPEFAMRFDITHTGVTIIEFNEKFKTGVVIPQILTMSNDSHIYSDGLPTKYSNTTLL